MHQGHISCTQPHHFVRIFLCLDYFTYMQYFRLLSQPPEHQKKYDYTGSRKQELANKISSSLWVRHSNQDYRVSYSRSERNTALQGQSISGCPTSGFRRDWCYALYHSISLNAHWSPGRWGADKKEKTLQSVLCKPMIMNQLSNEAVIGMMTK